MPWTFSHTFTVAGNGPFPMDMLRYDECWPQGAGDAAAIALDTTNLRARESRRCVVLRTDRKLGATIGRWRSFGWNVISHDERGLPLHADDLAAARAEFEAKRTTA